MARTTSTKAEPLSPAELLEQLHLALLSDVHKGLEDMAAGRVEDADEALARIQAARAHGDSRN